MNVFILTLKQMLLMFTLIIAGYVLRKKNILPQNADTAMAKLEAYIFCPSIYLYSQITRCNIRTFKDNYILLLYGLVIIITAIALAYPLSRLFIRNNQGAIQEENKRNVYKYALAFSNYGYMGNFIILGVWGAETFSKYTLFTFFISILSGSWGTYTLIPKDQSVSFWNNMKKGLLTPAVIAIIGGVLLGLMNFKTYIPEFFLDALEKAGDCQGPVAMLLAGFVIGGYDIKELINNKKVYIAALLRLIVIPAILMTILSLIGTSKEIMTLALIFSATPMGLNTIVFPAAYGGETETGASMTMISHTLSVITIPLMYYFFMVIL